jgi:hypothetical protein
MAKQRLLNQDALTDYPKFVAQCLSRFIRYNTKLQHLTLQRCGLNQQILIDILFAIKRSKSMQVLHVGANPGLCDEMLEFWRQNIPHKPEI